MTTKPALGLMMGSLHLIMLIPSMAAITYSGTGQTISGPTTFSSGFTVQSSPTSTTSGYYGTTGISYSYTLSSGVTDYITEGHYDLGGISFLKSTYNNTTNTELLQTSQLELNKIRLENDVFAGNGSATYTYSQIADGFLELQSYSSRTGSMSTTTTQLTKNRVFVDGVGLGFYSEHKVANPGGSAQPNVAAFPLYTFYTIPRNLSPFPDLGSTFNDEKEINNPQLYRPAMTPAVRFGGTDNTQELFDPSATTPTATIILNPKTGTIILTKPAGDIPNWTGS